MRDEYQQDRVGLDPLLELVDLQNKCDRSFNFNWTLQALKKQLYHRCRKEVVSALVIFIISCHDSCDNDIDETV